MEVHEQTLHEHHPLGLLAQAVVLAWSTAFPEGALAA